MARKFSILTSIGGKVKAFVGQAISDPRALAKFTIENVRDPSVLARMLTDVNAAILELGQDVASCPITGGILIQNLTFTAGQAQNIAHTLRRPTTGYIAVDAFGGYGVFQRLALPTDLDAKDYIRLQSQNAGTYAICIF